MHKVGIKDIMFFVIVAVLVAVTVFSKVYTENKDEKLIGIHVKGEVRAPGYYEINYGARIKDAIKYAGGETERADLNTLNLALMLRDGEEITIPAKNEGSEKETSDKININTADSYTLCKLEGIGEALARSIVEYRAQNGSFKSIDELKKIDGIGEEKLKKFASQITV